MNWVAFGVTSGSVVILFGSVFGLYYLFKKSKKAEEIYSIVIGLLPFIEKIILSFSSGETTHNVLNTVKHLSKTAAFILENKETITFDMARPLMLEYLNTCANTLNIGSVPENVVDAELKAAFEFMKESLKE